MRLLPDLRSQLVLDVFYPWNILYLTACLWQWYFEWKSAFYFIWSGELYTQRFGTKPHFLAFTLSSTPVLTISIFIFGPKKLVMQRRNQSAVMVYKSLNGLALQYLHSIFTFSIVTKSLVILIWLLEISRTSSPIPLPRNNYVKNSFSLLRFSAVA